MPKSNGECLLRLLRRACVAKGLTFFQTSQSNYELFKTASFVPQHYFDADYNLHLSNPSMPCFALLFSFSLTRCAAKPQIALLDAVAYEQAANMYNSALALYRDQQMQNAIGALRLFHTPCHTVPHPLLLSAANFVGAVLRFEALPDGWNNLAIIAQVRGVDHPLLTVLSPSLSPKGTWIHG